MTLKRLACILICILAAGCGGVRARRETLLHRAVGSDSHQDRRPSEIYSNRRCAACGKCCDATDSSGSSCLKGSDPDASLAAAELALDAGRRAEGHAWSRALSAYRDAARSAATALASSPGADPLRAIAIHNAAVERLLRLTWERGSGREAQQVLAQLGITVAGANAQLDPGRIESLDIAADYRVSGLSHRYLRGGLGVPVVVRWQNPREARRTVQDQYFPEQVVAAGTAVLHPKSVGGVGDTLTLHDPFEELSVAQAGGNSLSLAGDRTAALAVQVERDRSLRGAAFGGALTASLRRYDERLAMLRPHHPGRIPVVFVHGLASSPLIWAETLNELGNDPSLADRYEFWMFLYATGEPIPLSAAKLRQGLAAARVAFDPTGSDPTLHQMVVVGHSQGGLLTKTLVQDSGLTLWNEVLDVPHPATRLSAEARDRLDRALIFEPDPGVRRLVFVGTPHRGSPVADQPLVRLLTRVSRPEASVASDAREIRTAYGRSSIQGGYRGDILGIGNLRTASPVLGGLNKIPLDPSVPHHTIAMQLERFNPRGGDGLVPSASSHLDTAMSEVIVSGFHLDIDHAGVTEELRRILRLHLATEAGPDAAEPESDTVAGGWCRGSPRAAPAGRADRSDACPIALSLGRIQRLLADRLLRDIQASPDLHQVFKEWR